VLDEIRRQLETAGERLQVDALGGMVRVDRETRGQVELRRLLLGRGRGGDVVDADVLAERLENEALAFGVETEALDMLEQALLLGGVDMAVRLRGPDHRRDERELERRAVRGGRPVRLESGRRLDGHLGGRRRRRADGVLARLPVLIGLERERADGGRGPVADDPARHLPRLLVPQEHAEQAAGDHAAAEAAGLLGDAAANAACRSGHSLAAQELFQQFRRVQRSSLPSGARFAVM